MMLFIAAALASDGIARCTATLKTPDETLTVQAFAADFESGSLRVIEHAWLVADIDQHVDIYLGEVEVLVARYASIEPPDVPRVPGYEVRPGACEFVQVKRHSGDWDATWGDGYVTADLPWVALEAARRRKCFGDYQVAVGKGLPEARDALQVCLSKKATAPTPALRPLTEEIPTAPRFICVHEEGWVGGGVSLYEAREDALRAKVAGHSRETLGSVLAAIEAQDSTPLPTIELVEDSLAAEYAKLTCATPGRNLSFQTTSRCAGSSRTLKVSVGVDAAEVAGLCHAAHYEPTLSLLPSTVETGLPTNLAAGAIGLAHRCDAACRKGFE